MIVKVEKLFITADGEKWTTIVSHGHQYFTICERYDKSECLWMAKMFRQALKKHDKALLAKKK
jgi:hypothetical protein